MKSGSAKLINDPRPMIGLSDAGAHVTLLCDAGYCTYLLGHWVRDLNAITLEYAVKRLTSEPADFFGLKGRGRLTVGNNADVAIFDAATVGSARRGTLKDDLPGGGKRLVMPATGVIHTVVNGVPVYENERYTGVDAGRSPTLVVNEHRIHLEAIPLIADAYQKRSAEANG